MLVDQITGLADNILLKIISLLPLKEAGRTCILSKRWRYVWTCLPVLNFSDLRVFEIAENMAHHDVDFSEEGPSYISWVNQVVSLYRGRALDEFRLQFYLDEDNQEVIDNWINFATEKGVKRLELDLTDWYSYEDNYYTLPITFRCNTLTSLKLKHVNVTGEIVRSVLQNCPFLEDLLINCSISLINLKIEGDLLKLKHLAITYCHELNHIEIYAPNLVSFEYFGRGISVPLISTPKISDVSIGSGEVDHWTTKFLEISDSGYLSQLEALTLTINGCLQDSSVPDRIKCLQFPICRRLKCLRLTSSLSNDEDINMLGTVIKTCPFLHKFTLEIDNWNLMQIDNWNVPNPTDTPYQSQSPSCPHGNLKIVEVMGFVGTPIHCAFVMYIFENAFALEKLLVHSCATNKLGSYTKSKDGAEELSKRIKLQAEELRKKLNSRTTLVIL